MASTALLRRTYVTSPHAAPCCGDGLPVLEIAVERLSRHAGAHVGSGQGGPLVPQPYPEPQVKRGSGSGGGGGGVNGGDGGAGVAGPHAGHVEGAGNGQCGNRHQLEPPAAQPARAPTHSWLQSPLTVQRVSAQGGPEGIRMSTKAVPGTTCPWLATAPAGRPLTGWVSQSVVRSVKESFPGGWKNSIRSTVPLTTFLGSELQWPARSQGAAADAADAADADADGGGCVHKSRCTQVQQAASSRATAPAMTAGPGARASLASWPLAHGEGRGGRVPPAATSAPRAVFNALLWRA